MDKKQTVARLIYNYFVAQNSDAGLENFDETDSSISDAFSEFVSSTVDLATGQENALNQD